MTSLRISGKFALNDHLTIFTIGHSTRTLDEFVELLQTHEIKILVDVRTIPRSRKNPQFNTTELAESLKNLGIRYVHMPGLGGLRHAKKDSINTGWENASFRGYADYMQTEEFETALGGLIETGQEAATAIMCAEAVPWRCHRSLIADALLARGITVRHIMSRKSAKEHTLTAWAKVNGIKVIYPTLEH